MKGNEVRKELGNPENMEKAPGPNHAKSNKEEKWK